MKTIYLILLFFFIMSFVSCNDNVSVFQRYGFELETMPIPQRVIKGESVEIRCRLIKRGTFDEAKFFIRYFQSDGKGTLLLQDLKLNPNDRYRLNSDVFRLYYVSESVDQQVIDIYIEDSFGQIVQKNFSFTGNNSEED